MVCRIVQRTGYRKRVMVIVDGLCQAAVPASRAMATGAVVVSRLRKDAALFDLPKLAHEEAGEGSASKAGMDRTGSHWRIAADIDKVGRRSR